jgi:hypothetical protein
MTWEHTPVRVTQEISAVSRGGDSRRLYSSSLLAKEIESEVYMRYMGHGAGTPEHAHAAAQIPNKSTRIQMAPKYELICMQRTNESPEKIGEIAAGYGAGRISFRKGNDDWFACGEEGMRIADERCEVIDGLRREPASSAGVGSHARQVDQAAGDWVTMKSFSQLLMRAKGLKVAKSKFIHVRDDCGVAGIDNEKNLTRQVSKRSNAAACTVETKEHVMQCCKQFATMQRGKEHALLRNHSLQSTAAR